MIPNAGLEVERAKNLLFKGLGQVGFSRGIPEWFPAQLILQVRSGAAVGPHGVRQDLIPLLDSLRSQFGMNALTTLWPVGVRALGPYCGPAEAHPIAARLLSSGVVQPAKNLFGWDYSSPVDESRAREYLLATFPDRSNLEAAKRKALDSRETIADVEEVTYVPPPKDEISPEFNPDPRAKGTTLNIPKLNWAKSLIGYPADEPASPRPSEITESNVVVMDTGVDLKHPYLYASKVRYENLERYDDPIGHGTRVCGVVCGGLNGKAKWRRARTAPMTGLLPNAATTFVQVFRPDDPVNYPEDNWYLDLGSVTGYIDGLKFGKTKKSRDIKVLNMSFGMPISSGVFYDSIVKAVNAGYKVVAAVGNVGDPIADDSRILYPAGFKNVVRVGATTWNPSGKVSTITRTEAPNRPASRVEWSNDIDVYAPGDVIWCCNPTYAEEPFDGACWARGTSFAAPMVSAAWAYQLLYGNGATYNVQLEDALPMLRWNVF